MSTKNKQNISISGSSNVSLGDVSFNAANEPESKDNKEKATKPDPVVAEWKSMLAEGKTKEVVEKLLTHLKEKEDMPSINAVIMHSASLTQLEMQENLGVISYEQAKMGRAKVTNSLLQLMDGL
jgi:effector-associated domain 11 (EAD11)-containing protein